MNYKEMNIFDIASVLQNLCFDQDLSFTLNFNGREFNIFNVDVGDCEIILRVDCPHLKFVEGNLNEKRVKVDETNGESS